MLTEKQLINNLIGGFRSVTLNTPKSYQDEVLRLWERLAKDKANLWHVAYGKAARRIRAASPEHKG